MYVIQEGIYRKYCFSNFKLLNLCIVYLKLLYKVPTFLGYIIIFNKFEVGIQVIYFFGILLSYPYCGVFAGWPWPRLASTMASDWHQGTPHQLTPHQHLQPLWFMPPQLTPLQ